MGTLPYNQILETRRRLKESKGERMNLRPDLARFVEEWKLRNNPGARLTKENREHVRLAEEERLKGEKQNKEEQKGEAYQFYLEKLLETSKRKLPSQKHKIADIVIEDPSIPLPDSMDIPFSEVNQEKENGDLIMRHIRDD